MENDLARRAREAMLQFKKERGLKAILPKTKNQKLELARYHRSKRIQDAHEARKISHGAASDIRILKPEDIEDGG